MVYSMWFISRSSDISEVVFYTHEDGQIFGGTPGNPGQVYPSFYLLSTVKTNGGTGTWFNPYRIEL